MRKIRNLCSLLGHRRDKRRARATDDGWRSNCVRCDVGLKRTISGKWTRVAGGELYPVAHPVAQSALNPFLRPVPAKVAADDRVHQSDQQMKFAQDRVTAIAPQLRSGQDRRDQFIARAEEARLLAETAGEPHIKVTHLEMAARYYSLANYHLERPAPLAAVDSLRRIG